jgi:hypothetical protein
MATKVVTGRTPIGSIFIAEPTNMELPKHRFHGWVQATIRGRRLLLLATTEAELELWSVDVQKTHLKLRRLPAVSARGSVE